MGLLAQMISDPSASIKLVLDQPFGAAYDPGYDGPGECLRHVLDAPWMVPGKVVPLSWIAFDQGAFVEAGTGFQDQGWIRP